jgi:hypothetical protein
MLYCEGKLKNHTYREDEVKMVCCFTVFAPPAKKQVAKIESLAEINPY